jgi:hypothetical protein
MFVQWTIARVCPVMAVVRIFEEHALHVYTKVPTLLCSS